MKEQNFSEKDLHCIARLIQNSFQAPKQESIDNTYRPLYGCMYCKYAVSDCNKPEKINFQKVFKKLKELTGISISTLNPSPEQLGLVFLPVSHYLEHPEDLHYLESIHSHDDVENIKSCLDIVKSRSKEMSGQKQDNCHPVGNHCHNHNSDQQVLLKVQPQEGHTLYK